MASSVVQHGHHDGLAVGGGRHGVAVRLRDLADRHRAVPFLRARLESGEALDSVGGHVAEVGHGEQPLRGLADTEVLGEGVSRPEANAHVAREVGVRVEGRRRPDDVDLALPGQGAEQLALVVAQPAMHGEEDGREIGPVGPELAVGREQFLGREAGPQVVPAEEEAAGGQFHHVAAEDGPQLAGVVDERQGAAAGCLSCEGLAESLRRSRELPEGALHGRRVGRRDHDEEAIGEPGVDPTLDQEAAWRGEVPRGAAYDPQGLEVAHAARLLVGESPDEEDIGVQRLKLVGARRAHGPDRTPESGDGLGDALAVRVLVGAHDHDLAGCRQQVEEGALEAAHGTAGGRVGEQVGPDARVPGGALLERPAPLGTPLEALGKRHRREVFEGGDDPVEDELGGEDDAGGACHALEVVEDVLGGALLVHAAHPAGGP